MMRGRYSIFFISGWLVLTLGLPSPLSADDVLTAADRIVQQHLVYLYGSNDPRSGGLDCSGFVQVLFRQAYGIELPDEADQQLEYVREHGQVWDSTSGWTKATLQPGDLIFYAGPDADSRISLVSHVMIYCGHGISVGSQGIGKRLDGVTSGVGYYHFYVRRPKGVLGESGERFVGHRQVFAYGRLNHPPASVPQDAVASNPPAPTPSGGGNRPSPAVSVDSGCHAIIPLGFDPRFD
jgi:hypothetical protein